jgi:hypothetical protein
VHSDESTALVLVWATDLGLAQVLAQMLADAGRTVRILEDDAQLVMGQSQGSLLVAEAGPRLTAQQAFLRGPLIIVDPLRDTKSALARRAYAVVANPAEAALFVDRFFVHRRLSQQAAGRRSPPWRCSRCGRGFDARKAVDGATTTRRFIRFGAVALCGGCVEDLRSRLRQAETAIVEADV